MSTAPAARAIKRIIVCCDGTWEDGVTMTNRQSYTNILRLARTMNHEDTRFNPPIPQIVFYQSGIGSEKDWYSEYVVGITGASLGDKVEEAYAFIAHNYVPGDEIFLFGFSRGAYTARMVAMFIDLIGVLDRTDMDHFATIFLAYQKLGKTEAKNNMNDADEVQKLQSELSYWMSPNAPGKLRTTSPGGFSVKLVGVFETVGSLGLPSELTHHAASRDVFGFNDQRLGQHIQYAYHALALNEPRADFNCCKFEQTPEGAAKGQVLSQCWFSGDHADVGGGYKHHDLADITLFWMATNIADHLSLDYQYLGSLPQPMDPYGAQPPHSPLVGIYKLAHKIQRTPPTETNNVTHETIHSSVLDQRKLNPTVGSDIQIHPQLIHPLLPLEAALKSHWPALTHAASEHNTSATQTARVATETADTGLTTESGHRIREKNWLGKLAHGVHVILDKV
ncbi:DUF2235 domain-containing protein [Mycena chlorophos]|uniref:DUF2235 domain-containing protein n=1 Tax=Mycena chlorophos TaxID=658473 RepID=A0A8H6W9N2_MYCCL|nr:DUF2235 domain-containing protein [Mycena chlorophos]